MADDYVVGTAPDENASIGAKVVRAVGHILKGVVGEGQVGDRLVKRLASVPAFTIGLNAAAIEDASSVAEPPMAVFDCRFAKMSVPWLGPARTAPGWHLTRMPPAEKLTVDAR